MLKFRNGSAVIFRGSNNKQHRIRRGQEFNLAGIDEARDVDDLNDLIDSVVFPSLFSTDGYMIISSTPADTRSHALYQIRERAKLEGWLIEIPIYEAQKLDPEIYTAKRIEEWKEETLKGLDGQDVWEREYECKWVVNRTRVFIPEWDTSKMVMSFSPDPYDKFYHRYLGLDWGYKDYTGVVFATLNFRKGRLEVNGELTFSGKEVRTDLMYDRIKIQRKALYGHIEDFKFYRQVSDSADPILINEINRYKGMNVIPVEKANTLEAMVNEFRILVAQGKIVVDPKCSLLIHCLENAVWDENRDKLDQDVLAHHFDHLMALIYLTRMVDWQANPIPRDYMIDGVTIIDLNFNKKGNLTDSAMALQKAFGGRRAS